MPKKKVIHRSSKTGKLVTEQFADTHPTTEKEVVDVEAKYDIQVVGQRFASDDLNAVVDKVNEIILRLNKVI